MSAFTALVTPKRHGVGFYADQPPNIKTFAAHGSIGTHGIITQSANTPSTITLLTKDEARRQNAKKGPPFGGPFKSGTLGRNKPRDPQ
jgi:hypothetical protein